MAKNSMVLFLSFLAITVQYILYMFYGAQECFPYINNIAYSDDVRTNLVQVMLAFFPIPLYSFICYGYVRNNIVRDSYMKIIRRCSVTDTAMLGIWGVTSSGEHHENPACGT